MPSPSRHRSCAIWSPGQHNSESPGARVGCHPTAGFGVLGFPPVHVESLTWSSRTQPFWVCHSPVDLGPLGPSAVFVWKLFYRQVSGGAWEPLISMFTHILLFTHTALMGLTESQDLSAQKVQFTSF